MLLFLASLAWSVVAAYGVWSYDLLRRAELDAARTMALQRAAARQNAARAKSESRERIAGIRAAAKIEAAKYVADRQYPARPVLKPGQSEIQLPDDLEAFVMGWSDDFARDDERSNIRAKYLELHTGDEMQTWQKVRRVVGVGEMP